MEHLKRKHMGILDRDNMLLQSQEQGSIDEPGTSIGSQHSQPQSTSPNLPVSYFSTNNNCNEPTMATTESEPPLKKQKQLVLSNSLQRGLFQLVWIHQPLEGFRNMSYVV
ncbi:uncharacterized protein LOC126555385 [Aphis gossypii]|uniref:uncharacterized protein LOC126549984 n=1 Tax=Aphis gossypii TaxID=80765 RepID=UPI0021593E90|nr:uncharacterized protein LOC126549984 [Aphis gossypii]XP_050066272.1 uncharacterized protein LOC126555385 [Aphis gossypii]